MKTSSLGWSMIMVATALVACGDDSDTGSGGASGTASASTSGTTASVASSVGNSTNGPTPASASSGGTPIECDEESAAVEVFLNTSSSQAGGLFVYEGKIDPTVVDDADFIQIELYGGDGYDGFEPGTYDLGSGFDDDYASCSRCIRVFADNGSEEPTLYFQAGGTMTVTAVDPDTGLAQFSLENLVLVEVTIDPDSFESTPVDGGACLGIADVDLDPPPTYACDTTVTFGNEATNQCFEAIDGACAALEDCAGDSAEDIDTCITCINEGGGTLCDDTLAAIYESNCFTPSDAIWTCDDDAYWDGETCDCDCGAGDPDCQFDLPIEGCDPGETCGQGETTVGTCLPPEDACDDLTDNDEDGRFDCDDETSCSVALAADDCTPGDTPIGGGCEHNSDCTGVSGPPICLNEEVVGYPGGQCGEWCDLDDDNCPAGTVCTDQGPERGVCFPTCETGADCDNEEAACQAGVCVAGGIEGWNCNPGYYEADDGCDCGCGVVDPDCDDDSEDSCVYCFEPSCGDDGTGTGTCDLDLLVDDDNSQCE